MENPNNPNLPYFPCEPLASDFFETASARFVNAITLPVTPQRLFEIFEDAESWTKWVPGIANVEWTSSQPYGVGTTRTVFFTGGMEVYEDFTAWKAGEEMAFRFTGITQNVWSEFGEHYAVEDLGSGSCRLTWTVAYEPAGTFKKIHFLLRPLAKVAFKTFMKKLRKFCENDVREAVPARAT